MHDAFPHDSLPAEPKLATPELVAADALTDLGRLYEHHAEQARVLKQLLYTELKEGREPTALPADLENRHYKRDEAADAYRTLFLRARLHGRVLDIGAGSGNELANHVAEGSTITYLDAQPSTGPNHIQSDARNAPFDSQSFNSIYSRNCLGTGNVLDTKAIVSEARRMLVPGGTMVLATSYSTMEDTSKGVLDTLEALKETGVDISDPRQCEIAVTQSTIVHVSYVNQEGLDQGKPVGLTYPEVFLTVRPDQPAN